ncbi:MAG: DNA gyrase inhibitor YacG [Polyangiaceae bacterium]|nr:DNA gyrase inhibitor YacG [Polyangiaceae bacterium]
MRRSICPICAKQAASRAENSAFPFCSPRCRLVDLGKWLGEDYRLPESEPFDPEAYDEGSQ